MKRVKFCIIFCMMLLLIVKVSAKEYMDIKVKSHAPGYSSIVLYIRERKDAEKKYFWSCDFMQKGNFNKKFSDFLYKINGLSLNSSSPMYKPLKESCIEYDKSTDDDYCCDLGNSTIYPLDYSPEDEPIQRIIKSLQRLSNYYFKLDLLKDIMID